jgi:HlyD family secretion protein
LAAAFLAITGANVLLLPRVYAPRVEVDHVLLGPLPLIVRASGNLDAKQSTTIRAQFDGPLIVKRFREGQTVQKGELLGVLGRDRIRPDYELKNDALKNSQADLQKARRDLRLQRALFKRQAIAYSMVEDAQRAVVRAEQAVRAASDNMRLAAQQWDSSRIVAPSSGTVVKDWLGDEKNVSAGKEIVTVADVSQYVFRVRVDELEIKRVAEGQKAEVRLQAFPQTPLPAVVQDIGSQPEGNGLPEVAVVLRITESRGLGLRPKLTGEARISTGGTGPVLSVPSTAVSNAGPDSRVWLLDRFNRLRSRKVALGRFNPDRVEVLSGVAAGQRICKTVDGDFADGLKVVIGPRDPAKAAARPMTSGRAGGVRGVYAPKKR